MAYSISWKNNLFLALLIGVGIVFFLYWLSPSHDVKKLAKLSAQNIEQIGDKVYKGHPEKGGNFSDLTLGEAVAKFWIPAEMLRTTGVPARTRWGTKIDLQPHTVIGYGDGFSVVFYKIPKEACEEIPNFLTSRMYDVIINETSVLSPVGLDKGLVVDACFKNESSTMEFVFHDELVPKTAVLRKNQ